MTGLLGKKIGMTSIFAADGKQTACTIIEAGPCTVTQVKTSESDGYTALQLAFGDKKEKHSNQAEINHFSKAQTAPKKFVKEFRNYSIEKALGEAITVDIFAEGETVEVVGTTKWGSGDGARGVRYRRQRAAPTRVDRPRAKNWHAARLSHGKNPEQHGSIYACGSGPLAAKWLGLVVMVGGAGPHPACMSGALL